MDSKVCVTCGNRNAVNGTDNRLVTESCGHVKCMQCLLRETTGCIACKQTVDHETEENLEETLEAVVESTEDGDRSVLSAVTETQTIKEVTAVPKLETSHVKFDKDNQCYRCLVCKKRFKSRSQVSYHAYCNGQRKPYQCPEPDCNQSFRTHSHLEYHKRAHRKEKTYMCDMCGEGFYYPSKLQRHRLHHTKEKNHICTKCQKPFSNKSALKKHLLVHSAERPFPCPRCDRRFRDRSNLNKHIERHEAKMLSCTTCGREVLGRRALAEHAGRHAAGRHACPHCPQAFLARKDLRRHLHVHSDWKAFVCAVCGRRFHRKDNLVRHVKTHAEKEPRDCVLREAGPGTAAATPAPLQVDPIPLTKDNHDEISQKTKLKVLNPLPPLPQEVIQKHLSTTKEDKPEKVPVIDKKSIIEANNARESVIVGLLERKIPTPVTEYVHKIRKANLSSQKVVPLPPMDEYKFLELADRNNLDIGPLPKNIQLYKNILHVDKSEKQSEEEKAPEVHWRKKRLTDTE